MSYTMTLEAFLSRYFPSIKLFKEHNSDRVEVCLPEDPGKNQAERAVDEAFERFVP